jgi:hypothetical protein
MLLSEEPEAKIFPSGLNATLFTKLLWPLRGEPIFSPVAASHRMTVPSSLLLAKVFPSGLKDSFVT